MTFRDFNSQNFKGALDDWITQNDEDECTNPECDDPFCRSQCEVDNE